eukprot:2651758-Rhodomonas_salina.1
MQHVNSEQRLEHAQKIEVVTWGYWSPRDVSAKVCQTFREGLNSKKSLSPAWHEERISESSNA